MLPTLAPVVLPTLPPLVLPTAMPPAPSPAPATPSANETQVLEERKGIEGDITDVRKSEPDMNLGKSQRKSTCTIGLGQTCGKDVLHLTEPSLVYPGGNTGCLEGAPYAFRVYPGDPDKLYIHFQGGGACWDEATTMTNRACKDGLSAHPSEGVFNRQHPDNPLKNYTMVHVVYCSGDMHLGNTMRPYGAVQKGYHNSLAAIDWAKQNMPANLTNFVIGGCSAGSIAAQIWAGTLLDAFHAPNATVVLDSYLPIFPAGADARLFVNFESCGTLPLPENLKMDCTNGTLNMTRILQHDLVGYPNVTFAIINSKADKMQRSFSDMLSKSLDLDDEGNNSDAAYYYREVNQLSEFLHSFPNLFTYFVGGDCAECHCYVVRDDRFYNATPHGLAANGTNRTSRTPAAWLRRLVESPDLGESACDGQVLPKVKWQSEKSTSVDYCPEPYMSEKDIKAFEQAEAARQKAEYVPFAFGVGTACIVLMVLAATWYYCRFHDPKDMCEALHDEDSDDESP